MTAPNMTLLAAARQVATNPAAFLDSPTLFVGAFVTLKAARGQTVRLNRLNAPAHLVQGAGCQPAEATALRMRRALAERLGPALFLFAVP